MQMIHHHVVDIADRTSPLNNSSIIQHNPPPSKVKDVVVGYLVDNSPDLLLSILGCIDLTTTCNDETTTILPAMINVRWTPLEMKRALSSSLSTNNNDGQYNNSRYDGIDDDQRSHATIILYGRSYEDTAKEAVRLMNDDGRIQHFATALLLPELSNDTASDINTATSATSHQQPNDISNKDALILFTSGTSSPNGAKGVRLSHRSLYVQAWAKTQPPCNYSKETSMVATTVPWFHVGGVSSAFGVLMGRGCLVFPRGIWKGFKPENVIRALLPSSTSSSNTVNCGYRVSHDGADTLVVVPAMLHAIFELMATRPNDSVQSYPNVRLILVGGQSIGSGRLLQQTRRCFPNARIVQTYACTEAGSSITFHDMGYKQSDSTDDEIGVDGAACVGLPPSHVETGIFDPQTISMMNDTTKTTTTIRPIQNGKMGIIGTRGTHTMSGYWNRGGTDQQQCQNVHEWMFTNDLGYIHPRTGKLYFCGRANDVIRTGGESVLATEVEKVIGLHNDIVECVVFALPDAKFGEAVCVAVVLEASSSVNEATEDFHWLNQLRQHCAKNQLAGFKQPRRVFCINALPRNSSGKVLKHEIVEKCSRLDVSARSRL